MKYLLYCIFHNPTYPACNSSGDLDRNELNAFMNVEGETLFSVSSRDLCALVTKTSLHSESETPSVINPDITQLLDYGKVIESIHRTRTVIPMRYGCVFDKESQIIRFLEEGYQKFKALLIELEGCVEIGIRILNSVREADSVQSGCANDQTVNVDTFSGSGRNYLNARKAHYSTKEFFSQKTGSLIKKYTASFDGLFVKVKTELPSSHIRPPAIGDIFLTLYFLVPRGSVESFRAAFRQMCATESAKLLMSGPWPPYNFVTTAVKMEDLIQGER
jgi:hypothetical protein